MPWFEFEKPFNWDIPGTGQTVAYKPRAYYVKQECADAAAASGAGKVVDRPKGAKAPKAAPKPPAAEGTAD